MESLDNYLDWLEELGRSRSTLNLYERTIRLAYDHPQGPLGRVTDRRLAPTTRRTTLAILKGWAKWLQDTELYENLQRVKMPSDQRIQERPPLSREEWQDLRDVIATSDELTEPERAALGLMAARGFRVGDVLRLKRTEAQAALRTGRLLFTAKGDRRLRFTTQRIRPYLEALVAHKGWDRVHDLISPYAADPQTAAIVALQRRLKVVAQEAGIDPAEMYSHRLRRTYSTMFLQAAKGDINKLKQHMQWSDISVAARYVDYIQDEELDAIADQLD